MIACGAILVGCPRDRHEVKIRVRGSGCSYDVTADVVDRPGATSELRSGSVARGLSGEYVSPSFRVASGARVTFHVAPEKGASCTALSGELHLDGRTHSRSVTESPPFGSAFHLDVEVP